jgi:hypothetical protein
VTSQKHEHGGMLKVNIRIVCYGDNLRTVALRQMTSGTVNDRGHTYRFALNIILFDEACEGMFGQSQKHFM